MENKLKNIFLPPTATRVTFALIKPWATLKHMGAGKVAQVAV
jgi:hypothetical protein